MLQKDSQTPNWENRRNGYESFQEAVTPLIPD